MGGEFTLLADSDLRARLGDYRDQVTKNLDQSGTFQTFCIEQAEYIGGGTTYYVGLNDSVLYNNHYPAGSPLTLGAAYLYFRFATGNLPGYNYTNPGRGGSGNPNGTAGDLQKAIWWLQGEFGDGATENAFAQAAIDAVAAAGGNYSEPNFSHGSRKYPVMVLNLWGNADLKSSPGQDQLVLVSTPDAGSSAMLLGATLVGIAGCRRRLMAGV